MLQIIWSTQSNGQVESCDKALFRKAPQNSPLLDKKGDPLNGNLYQLWARRCYQ